MSNKRNKTIKMLVSWGFELNWEDYFDEELYNRVEELGYEWEPENGCWHVLEHFDCYED